MASAGLIFLGAFAVWMAAAPWPLAPRAALGAAMLGLSVWAAGRLRVADGAVGRLITRAPAAALLHLKHAPALARDTVRVVLAALGARQTAPVFVRLKLKPADAAGNAAVITALSAAPGGVVIDADGGSLLAHALVESDVHVPALQARERDALRAGGGAQAR
ncbi:MAG: Na+/H+ antiporter subunit E [Hyphomonadaceae bacterium]|nr:Na+/H+ antiporter subunit E [Hyphomonadaceae bacterium]